MTCDATTILRLLTEQGGLSAYHLARIIGCTPARVLAVIADMWWEIVPEAGPEGWLYALRQTLSRRLDKPADKPKEYAGRTVKPGSYA